MAMMCEMKIAKIGRGEENYDPTESGDKCVQSLAFKGSLMNCFMQGGEKKHQQNALRHHSQLVKLWLQQKNNRKEQNCAHESG